jgi:hypothetical protein
MGLPIMKEFCCGISIKKGALIIGYSGLLLTLLSIIPLGVDAPDFKDYIIRELNKSTHANMDDILQAADEVFNICYGIIFTLIGLSLLIGLLLVIGIHKNNRCCMYPWLILSGIGCILLIFCSILLTLILPVSFFAGDSREVFSSTQKFSAFCATITNTIINCYMFLIVYAHFKSISFSNEGFSTFVNTEAGKSYPKQYA